MRQHNCVTNGPQVASLLLAPCIQTMSDWNAASVCTQKESHFQYDTIRRRPGATEPARMCICKSSGDSHHRIFLFYVGALGHSPQDSLVAPRLKSGEKSNATHIARYEFRYPPCSRRRTCINGSIQRFVLFSPAIDLGDGGGGGAGTCPL